MKTKEEFLQGFKNKPDEATGGALYAAYTLGYEEGKSDWAFQWNKAIEEGIEKAVWLSPDEMPEVLKNSYENIKLLFEDENSIV